MYLSPSLSYMQRDKKKKKSDDDNELWISIDSVNAKKKKKS